jgi:rhodanese-related sulfurtransferase
MKINPFIRFLILFCVFVSVFVGSGSTAIEVGGKVASIPTEHSAQAAKRPSPLLSISPEALLHKMKQNQPITLVDIRMPGEFDKARIPGSINIPLYAIRTKAFLRSAPFVFVEDGYHYRSMEKECGILKEAGFKAFHLIGGLNAWKQRGGPLQGKAFEVMALNRIFPQAYYQEKDQEEWMVIDASAKQTPKSIALFPNALHMPFRDVAEFVVNIKKKMESGKSNLSYPLLVFNEEGNQYEKFESNMSRAGFGNAFYLQGGLMAYEAFIDCLALSRAPREERLKTLRECPKCGNEN